MKISKNLLQAILIGATLGTAATSCEMVRDNSEIDHKYTEYCETECNVTQNAGAKETHSCPGCGMG